MSLYGTDLLALLPELIIVVAACLVIVLDPITPASRRDLLAWLSVGALALCLGITGGQISVLNDRMSAFNNLVVIDAYARFWKIVLYGVTGLTILLSLPYLKAERTHLGEFYGFVLLALSGMMVMVSGADLLTIYLGTELMSLALCDDRAQSGEASFTGGGSQILRPGRLLLGYFVIRHLHALRRSRQHQVDLDCGCDWNPRCGRPTRADRYNLVSSRLRL